MTIREYITIFRRNTRSQPRAVTAMVVFLVANIALALALPNTASRFILEVQERAPQRLLVLIAVLYLVVALLSQAVNAFAVYWSERVGWTATNQLRGDLMEHVLDLDLRFHESRSAGEMIERIDGDVNQINRFFSGFIVGLLGNALLLLGILIALTVINIILGISFLVLTAAGMILLSKSTHIGTPYWESERQQSALFYGELSELLGCTEDIRALNAEPHAMSRFYQRVREWLPIEVRATTWSSSVWIATIVLFTFATMLAYGVGGSLRGHGILSLSVLYLVVSYSLMLTGPMEAIRNELQDAQQAVAAVSRTSALLTIQRAQADGPVTLLRSGPLDVEFRHVSFGYTPAGDGQQTSGQPVFSDFSFTLAAGRTLGLAGRTGSGKSTIASLLFRHNDPQSGQVRVGGHDVRNLTLRALRQRIGLVTQQVHIFDASVRDNLTFFEPADDGTLAEILSSVGLGEWLGRLPAGLDTKISANSVSAGEAQLLAFARVFLKDPGLVILDEPSSRLDPATEAQVQRALGALLVDRTVILIAHRLDALRRTDEILVIDNGAIVERGPTASLLDDPDSVYATLLRTGALT